MCDRQKRYRRRQRQGVAVYRVNATDRVLHALIAAQRLTDDETADRDRIEAELSALVQEWADRWPRK